MSSKPVVYDTQTGPLFPVLLYVQCVCKHEAEIAPEIAFGRSFMDRLKGLFELS